MKWTVESRESKKARLSTWHLCFAVIPHRVVHDDSGVNEWMWLQTVGRKYEYDDYGGGKWPKFCSKENAMAHILGES